MSIPLEAAAAAMREAMRETVKRYSLWYLLQGVLMVAAGVLALIYPVIASVGIVFLLAWVLILSGLVQGIGLIGARQVPHFWLQLISVVLSIVVGRPFDRLFHGRGHGQGELRADHQAVPQLGLGAGGRPRQHRACALSLDQFRRDIGMGARLPARHPAPGRGRGTHLPSLAHPRELRRSPHAEERQSRVSKHEVRRWPHPSRRR